MRIPAAFLPHTITVTKKEGEGAYGPIYQDPVGGIKARVEFTSGVTKGSEGQDLTYQARIFLGPDDLAKVGPEATVQFESFTLEIIRVAPQYDIQGNMSHIEMEAQLG